MGRCAVDPNQLITFKKMARATKGMEAGKGERRRLTVDNRNGPNRYSPNYMH